jgi:Tfp pilus assembly ATPase PilU
MASVYDMQDLLNLISHERAEKLVVNVGKPPSVFLHDEEHVVEGRDVSRENAAELFRSVATPEQVRELDACGESRFIYTSAERAKFGVTAKIEREDISLEIRNLAVSAT